MRPPEKAISYQLATVVASSATDTDVLSTALLVLGEAGLPQLRAHFPDMQMRVVR
jgi:thiamine biosynthesis lipoprotein ApbE